MIKFILTFILLLFNFSLMANEIDLDEEELTEGQSSEFLKEATLDELHRKSQACRDDNGAWKIGSVKDPAYDKLWDEVTLGSLERKNPTIFKNACDGQTAGNLTGECRRFNDQQTRFLTKKSRILVNADGTKVPQKINCTGLERVHFSALKGSFEESGQTSIEASISAKQCLTQGWHIQDQVRFFRDLEDPEAILGGKLGELFKDQCLAEKKEFKGAANCTLDFACTLFGRAGDAASYLLKKVGATEKGCDKYQNETSCASEAVTGVLKSLFSTAEGIYLLGKFAWDQTLSAVDGASEYFFGQSKQLESELSSQQLLLENKTGKTLSRYINVSDPSQGIANLMEDFGKLFDGLGKSVGNSIVDNFGCLKWNKNAPVNRKECEKPFVSSECATCGQKANITCGLIGFLGSEALQFFLTGGTNLASGAAKVTSNITKGGYNATKGTAQTVGNGVKGAGKIAYGSGELLYRGGKLVARGGKRVVTLDYKNGKFLNTFRKGPRQKGDSLVGATKTKFNEGFGKVFTPKEQFYWLGQKLDDAQWALRARKAAGNGKVVSREQKKAQSLLQRYPDNKEVLELANKIKLQDFAITQKLKDLDKVAKQRYQNPTKSKKAKQEYDRIVADIKNLRAGAKKDLLALESKNKALDSSARLANQQALKQSKIKSLEKKAAKELAQRNQKRIDLSRKKRIAEELGAKRRGQESRTLRVADVAARSERHRRAKRAYGQYLSNNKAAVNLSSAKGVSEGKKLVKAATKSELDALAKRTQIAKQIENDSLRRLELAKIQGAEKAVRSAAKDAETYLASGNLRSSARARENGVNKIRAIQRSAEETKAQTRAFENSIKKNKKVVSADTIRGRGRDLAKAVSSGKKKVVDDELIALKKKGLTEFDKQLKLADRLETPADVKVKRDQIISQKNTFREQFETIGRSLKSQTKQSSKVDTLPLSAKEKIAALTKSLDDVEGSTAKLSSRVSRAERDKIDLADAKKLRDENRQVPRERVVHPLAKKKVVKSTKDEVLPKAPSSTSITVTQKGATNNQFPKISEIGAIKPGKEIVPRNIAPPKKTIILRAEQSKPKVIVQKNKNGRIALRNPIGSESLASSTAKVSPKIVKSRVSKGPVDELKRVGRNVENAFETRARRGLRHDLTNNRDQLIAQLERAEKKARDASSSFRGSVDAVKLSDELKKAADLASSARKSVSTGDFKTASARNEAIDKIRNFEKLSESLASEAKKLGRGRGVNAGKRKVQDLDRTLKKQSEKRTRSTLERDITTAGKSQQLNDRFAKASSEINAINKALVQTGKKTKAQKELAATVKALNKASISAKKALDRDLRSGRKKRAAIDKIRKFEKLAAEALIKSRLVKSQNSIVGKVPKKRIGYIAKTKTGKSLQTIARAGQEAKIIKGALEVERPWREVSSRAPFSIREDNTTVAVAGPPQNELAITVVKKSRQKSGGVTVRRKSSPPSTTPPAPVIAPAVPAASIPASALAEDTESSSTTSESDSSPDSSGDASADTTTDTEDDDEFADGIEDEEEAASIKKPKSVKLKAPTPLRGNFLQKARRYIRGTFGPFFQR